MPSTYTSLNVHVVFATRDRAPMIGSEWMRDLHGYLAGTVEGLGAKSFAVGGVADHVHLLIGLRPLQSVADIVREIKKASSVWACERYHAFGWQSGYGAFSVSASDLDTVRAYIARQEEHHRTLSSADELRALLAEHAIDYDPRYFD